MKRILLFYLILSSPALGRIRHVPQDFSTIQAAINVCFEDDTVLVAPGTYQESINFNGINITLGSQYITTGDTSFISSTILDGSSSRRVVIFDHNEQANARLKGFTIKNGHADNGGGILCINCSPTISDNIIRGNTATGAGKGGGILCDSSANPTVSNNRFTTNHAAYGAALSCLHDSSPTIDGNDFRNHSISDFGGAIYCEGSAPYIINNTFMNNSAPFGGALNCYDDSPARIKNNIFTHNHSTADGAAIYCYSSDAIIDSNTITNNHAGGYGAGISILDGHPSIGYNTVDNNGGGWFGGGIYTARAMPTITDNFIRGDTADQGGGVVCSSSSYPTIARNVISNNVARFRGGGVEVEVPNSYVYENTITNNRAYNYGGGIFCWGPAYILRNVITGNLADSGGGIACQGYAQTIANNIFMRNSAIRGGALACIEGADVSLTSSILRGDTLLGRAEIFVSDSATVAVNYCDITGGYQGSGNIDVEPLLRNPAAGDFRLMSTACGDSFNSPCIDTGDRNYIDTLLGCQWGLGSRLCDMGIYGGRMPAGHVLNVPGRYRHIQTAIDSSQVRDTVLVQPGTYRERLNFHNKNVVVGSLYMTTGDTSYIHSTIISGDSTIGTLVTIAGYQDSTTVLQGFTVQNAHTDGIGGGIKISNSNPKIDHNIFRNNLASSGGGMYCQFGGYGVISNNVIVNNSIFNSRGQGAGIMVEWGSLKFFNNIIVHNNANGAHSRGGGIGMYGTGGSFINNTISENWADSGGGIYIYQASPTITNTIVWSNTANVGNGIIVRDQNSHPVVTYSNIEGGREGTGNINVDPLFRDTIVGDWHLMSTQCGYVFDSPCIDSGDPARIDSLLSCAWGLGAQRSDIGAFGGGRLLSSAIEDERPKIPEQIILQQNYPNPFNAQTTISFALPRASHVTVNIYDLLGRQVARLLDEDRQAGYHQLTWNAGNLPSGMYFYRIQAGEFGKTKKMLLLK